MGLNGVRSEPSLSIFILIRKEIYKIKYFFKKDIKTVKMFISVGRCTRLSCFVN